MSSAYNFYLSGIEVSLSNNDYISGKELSIADISFVCDLAQFLREGHYQKILKEKGFELISSNFSNTFPRSFKHLLTLSRQEYFASVLGSYLDWYIESL